MNKKRLLLSLASLFILTGCTISKRNSPTTSNSTSQLEQDAKIQQIYDLYKAAGGTLSYEEWLATIKGEQGAPGKDGQDGKDGVDGSTILSGAGAPSFSLGKVGDIYIDTSSWDLWKKTNTGWIKIGNLKGEKGDTGSQGPTGPAGPQGEPGSDGSTVLSGNGQPANQLGKNGDVYINLSTGDYYQKENDAWTLKGNIKGPQGEQGVSIVSSYINENGDLIVVFSNGQKLNVGHIKDVNTYTVSFHVDDEIVATRVVSSGSTVSRPTLEETAGYTINDWFTKDGEYTTSWNFQGCVVTTDIDLWAEFDYNQYKISFSDNKHNKVVSDIYVLYDHEYNLPQLSETGYTFNGWKFNDEIIPNNGVYRFSKDINLTAVWDANKYNVSLDADGGSLNIDSVEVIFDAEYSLPTPTKTGFTFIGWYDGDDFFSSNSVWKYNENKSLVARWTNVSMTFTFDPGEGNCDIRSMVILYGDEYTLPTATRNGYFLNGWKLNGTLLEQNGVWTYSTEGAVLIADWIETGFDFSKDILYFGYYPQRRAETDISSELDKLTTPGKNGWYFYNNNYYAKVVADNDSHEGDFIKGETYWFLVEKLPWRKCQTDGSKITYITNNIIDSHIFYDGPQGSASKTSYVDSYLRTWLIDEFYNTAFEQGKEYLNPHEMECSYHNVLDNETGDINTVYSTINDKVYVISSIAELNNIETTDGNEPTDYMRCKGAQANKEYNGNKYLYHVWRRSNKINYGENYAFYKSNIDNKYQSVTKRYYDKCGVRPSIIVSTNI